MSASCSPGKPLTGSVATNPIEARGGEPTLLLDHTEPSFPSSQELSAAETRRNAVFNIGALPWLPQLPDDKLSRIYEQLRELEHSYIGRDLVLEQYGPGTATKSNEIVTVKGGGDVVFTAAHATMNMRVNKADRSKPPKFGFADTGTAALTSLLAQNHGTGLIMVGRQTGNAAADSEHVLHKAAAEHMTEARGLLDVHGCASHLYTAHSVPFNVHASIGLGLEPREIEWEIARKLVSFGRDLGLYVIIGNEQDYYSQDNTRNLPKRNADGTLYRGRLAAGQLSMLTNTMRRGSKAPEQAKPTIQIELAGLLRLTAEDDLTYPKDKNTKIIGAALGYLLMEQAAIEIGANSSEHATVQA